MQRISNIVPHVPEYCLIYYRLESMATSPLMHTIHNGTKFLTIQYSLICLTSVQLTLEEASPMKSTTFQPIQPSSVE